MYALPELWGVLNTTPDSFSDGGLFLEPAAARARIKAMLNEGADIIDIGGESTRPPGRAYGAGFKRVAPEIELARVLPAIEAARACGARVSIDTTKLEVARAALERGAEIVNYVGLHPEEPLLELIASRGADLVLMHNAARGERLDPALRGEALKDEVFGGLLRAAERAERAGVRGEIYLDIGIGFAKTSAQSIECLRALPELGRGGYPLYIGASRKSLIADIEESAGAARSVPDARLGGSLAFALFAAQMGARALRVHDVAPTRQALLVSRALLG